MPASAPTTIPVRTPSRSYDVIVGGGLLARLEETTRTAVLGAARCVLVCDSGIPKPDHAIGLTASLARGGISVAGEPVRLTPSEPDKSLATCQRILHAMTAARLERGDVLVALGGGVVGDIAGFAAATYRRGIRWINCPSTLLSMVDASVGGKTGVNLFAAGHLHKNMAGAFWQPSLVAADVGLLASLDERVFRSGLAECIKHGMLAGPFGDAELGHWTKANLALILARNADALTELVARNVGVKARVVAGDEREESTGNAGRALLNLGHTFGHAFETVPGAAPSTGQPGPLQHGEAVALGLVCAARCAEEQRLVGAGFAETVVRTLDMAGLPTAARGLPPAADVLERMRDDKKAAAGRMRLVLPIGEGACRMVDDAPEAAVLRAIESVRRSGATPEPPLIADSPLTKT